MMPDSIVKVEKLSHKYSVQWAVRDISFEVSTPGIYGLLGANGAGKSTTMNIMCGVLRQTHGEVFIKGINLRERPVEAKKHIGFLPQHPPLSPELTVEEFLTYCAHLRLMPPGGVAAAVSDVMEKCQISHFRRRLISNLSGGYQQRVGIAQAIIHQPDFVVLDEPTNGLDPNQILEVRKLIREIAQDRTVVLSTHILQEVQALCDHIWMVNEGRMIFSGPLQDFDNYLQPNSLTVSLRSGPGPDGLKALEGILNVEELSPGKFRVYYADSREVTDLLVATSYQKGWGLEELSLDRSSLENIFSAITHKVS